jgi:rhodanese-related sulfurtransferase
MAAAVQVVSRLRGSMVSGSTSQNAVCLSRREPAAKHDYSLRMRSSINNRTSSPGSSPPRFDPIAPPPVAARTRGRLLRLSLCSLALLASVGCSTNITDRDITEASVARTRDLSQEQARDPSRVLLLDSRPEAAFNAGHIPGARNFRLAEVGDSRTLDSLRGYHTIVVYGRDPGDASSIALTKSLLAERRMGRVVHFAGGMRAWEQSGYAIQTGN